MKAPGLVAPDKSPRVLMLGIDAMSLPFAIAHLDHLPTLKALLGRGRLVEPESTGDEFPASGWPTFISGKTVGEIGQYFPFQWDAKHLKQRRLGDNTWRDEFVIEPFWHELARAGVSSTVLDVSSVLNDRLAPCRQITNWSCQDSANVDASDPMLLAEIRHRFGRRPIGAEVPVPKKRGLCLKIRDQLIESIEKKTEAVLWLMQRDAWQFFLVVFHEAHRAGHNLWPDTAAFGSQADSQSLLDVYKALDWQMQRIFDHAEDERTTVMVFALHGMGPNKVQDHFLIKIMSRLNARYLAERGFTTRPAMQESVMSVLRKTVPYNVQYYLAKLLGERVQDFVVNRAMFGAIDWTRTPAFRLSSGGEGFLRLNIKGREARGFFEPDSDEIERYVDWLKKALLEISVGDTDEPLVKSVLRTQDIFIGPKAHFLPDILIDWAPDAPVEHIHSEKIGHIHERLRTGRGGNHAGRAFVAIAGPGAESGAAREIAHIKDIGRFVRSCFKLAPEAEVNAASRVTS